MSLFKKAERKRSFLRIALTGPSGSGKTFSALELAAGLGGKTAVIDTENGSASLYAERFDFDVVELAPPFTAARYIELIEAAEADGYTNLIIDSLSPAWAGEGGVQDKKDTLDARGGSKFANWKAPKADHQKLKDAILFSNMHVIATIRSKQGYLQSSEGGGSAKIQKVGMDPIAEPGIEYEFTTVFDIDMAHKAMTSKDRTGLFGDQITQITRETGALLIKWLGGEPVKIERARAPAQAAMNRPATKTAPAPVSQYTLEELQEYVVPSSFRTIGGKALGTCAQPDILASIKYWEQRDRGSQPLTGPPAEFLEKACAYLDLMNPKAESPAAWQNEPWPGGK